MGVDDSQRLTTHVVALPGVTILAFQGDLDVATRDHASDVLGAALRGEPPMLVLDIRTLGTMDAAGILFLLGARTRSESAGVRLVVLDGSGHAHQAIRRAGVLDDFEMIADPRPA